MKIYLTRFVFDGKEYAGPDIHAENMEDAELIAEYSGLIVDGELTDIMDLDLALDSDLDFDSRPRVLH